MMEQIPQIGSRPTSKRVARKKQCVLQLGPSISRFPPTRYQGSKLKLLDWIWTSIKDLSFDTCLDLFSGTASVAYLLKIKGKQVTTNDYLLCNKTISDALVCNNDTKLPLEEVDKILEPSHGAKKGFISEVFDGVFYTTEENRWLDSVSQRIYSMPQGFKRSIAYFGLYQACLAKRPYNLFHRANLYMRLAKVERGFGNKATWDKPFREHFIAGIHEANEAIWNNGRSNKALCGDFLSVPGTFDLVYMDSPYLNSRGVGVDYLDFYHFLEGLTEYPEWPDRITNEYKHKPYKRRPNAWNKKETIHKAFDAAIDKYKKSIIVISYRSNGIPTIDELVILLQRHGRRNAATYYYEYKYVLANGNGNEVLLVSEPG